MPALAKASTYCSPDNLAAAYGDLGSGSTASTFGRTGVSPYTELELEPGKGCKMRRGLFVMIGILGLTLWGPAHALESGASCDIEDDAVQPDAMKEFERILKELSTPTS